jgi:peptidylprolyl isomerase/peptidyl-prolyl cis-trans isomerase B (cyclophilin B)
MKMKFKVAIVASLCIVFGGLAACGAAKSRNGKGIAMSKHPEVLFEMENGGKFTIELYPEYAPETVKNFEKLVGEGFYDGLTFHRVVDGFMAQAGDPNGNGTGGSSETIKGEFSSNGFRQNVLKHTRGIVSMARSSNPNSASSQFFICYTDADFLDGNYAAFGRVLNGMDVVDGFLKIPRKKNNMSEDAIPTTPIVIKHATIVRQ